jgi:Ca2+-binding EF-hand superfamily protein
MDADAKEEMAEQNQCKVGHITAMEKCYQIFAKGDDEIRNKELGQIMRELGANPTEEEVQDMINELEDDNVSGSLEFPEFFKYNITKMKAEGVDDQIKKSFDLMNSSKSGGITAEELKAVMTKAGMNLSADEINDMMVELGGGTGIVNYNSFKNCMTKSETAPWPLQ